MQKVVTVIPTHNRKDYLAQVLKDLSEQVDINCLHEVVVVVAESTDGTMAMLSSDFPDVHIVRGKSEWWYTRCMNEGFQKALSFHPELVLAMNDDVRLPKNYLSALLSASNAEMGICIMGSLSVTESLPHRITFSGIKEIKWWRYQYIPHLLHNSEVAIETLSGVRDSKVLPGRGMLIPAGLLRELRGFDSQLVQYGSDDDFCLRAAKQRVAVKVCYDAVVYSYEKLTGIGNPSRKDSIWDVIRGFGNKYSTLYLPKTTSAIRRHGNSLLLPLTLLIVIIGSIRANYKFRKV